VETLAAIDGVRYVAANRDLEYFNADMRDVTGVDSVRADTGYDGSGVRVAVVVDTPSRLGGASVSELADELGRDPSTVTHHLQRLDADDMVVREREGRAVINCLSVEARARWNRRPSPRGPRRPGRWRATDRPRTTRFSPLQSSWTHGRLDRR
jgi:DNA-binding transcriptional ArsR family regulator